MVHEEETGKTGEQHDDIVSSVMAKQDSNQELVRVSRAVTPKLFSETPVLVTINVRSIVQIDAFTQFEQCQPYKIAHSVMDAFQQNPFYVIVANAATSVIKLARHPRVATTSAPRSEILHTKNDEYLLYLLPSNVVDVVNVVHCKPTCERLQ